MINYNNVPIRYIDFKNLNDETLKFAAYKDGIIEIRPGSMQYGKSVTGEMDGLMLVIDKKTWAPFYAISTKDFLINSHTQDEYVEMLNDGIKGKIEQLQLHDVVELVVLNDAKYWTGESKTTGNTYEGMYATVGFVDAKVNQLRVRALETPG